jgi:hypothetical protein
LYYDYLYSNYLFIDVLIIKKTSYQEYGVAGVLISLISCLILILYLLFR